MPKRNQRNNHHNGTIHSSIVKSTSDSILSKNNSNKIISNGGSGWKSDLDGSIKLTLKEQQQMDKNIYLTSQTKEQLKLECRKRGQKTTGTKMELLQRLGFKMIQSQKQHSQEIENSTNSNLKLTKSGQNKLETTGSVGNSNIKSSSSNGNVKLSASFIRKQSAKDREKERNERSKIVLWRHPIQTVKYCTLEMTTLLHTYGKKLLENKISLFLLLVLMTAITAIYHVPGRHQVFIEIIRTYMFFVTYWVGLGFLSSVGLGTGLHTFILYLGPHIASVTLAAYECNSLDFPKPPYPDDIICPEKIDPNFVPSLWNIMSKVRFEAFLWGAGTALGELPPYFMARAARLTGYDPDDDEELQEFEELKKKQEQGVNLNILDRAKLSMEKFVERVGFLGILACASIPNPLFDLAGITCGHFLVPFWTFFGATLIGKAVIKMHIQKIFVIIAFNELLIEKAVDILGSIPIIGKRAQIPFKSFLQNQKTKLHRGTTNAAPAKSNIITVIYEKIVILMIMYFIVSMINSLAQNYHKRIHKKTGKVFKKIAKD